MNEKGREHILEWEGNWDTNAKGTWTRMGR